MDLSVQAAVVGTVVGIVALIGATIAVVLVVVRRRRANLITTSQRLADLHTSYDSLKAAMVAMDRGDYTNALTIGEHVIRGSALSPHTVTVAHLLVGEAASRVGALRTAVRHLPRAIEATQRGSLVAPLSELLRMQSAAKAGLCEFEEAVALAKEATRTARVSHDKAASLCLEAEINLLRGDFGAAETSLAAAVQAAGTDMDQAPIDHLTGRLLAASGDLDKAMALLKTAQARYERGANPLAAATVMLDLAEVTERLEGPGPARTLMRTALSRSEEQTADHAARAVMLAKAAGIEAAAGDLATAEHYRNAAQRFFTATDLPSAEAYLAWVRARIAMAMGDANRADAASWEAQDEATRLGMGLWRNKIERERLETMDSPS